MLRVIAVIVIAGSVLTGCSQPGVKDFRLNFAHIKFDSSDFEPVSPEISPIGIDADLLPSDFRREYDRGRTRYSRREADGGTTYQMYWNSRYGTYGARLFFVLSKEPNPSGRTILSGTDKFSKKRLQPETDRGQVPSQYGMLPFAEFFAGYEQTCMTVGPARPEKVEVPAPFRDSFIFGIYCQEGRPPLSPVVRLALAGAITLDPDKF